MSVQMGTAGLICFLLAIGHATIGFRWVLPDLTRDRFVDIPFGSASTIAGMVRFSWHMVTVVLFGFSGLLVTLSFGNTQDPRTVVLRWVALQWVLATAIALWQVRRRPSSVLRFPVPLSFPAVAVLCWMASS